MGLNTTVIIMNDALGYIENDPYFGKRLVAAILASNGEPIDVPAANGSCVHCNAATVIDTHHANNTAIIAVGGNCATVLGNVGGSDHRLPAQQKKMLKEVMAQVKRDEKTGHQ